MTTLGYESTRESITQIWTKDGRFRVLPYTYGDCYVFEYVSKDNEIVFYLPKEVENKILDSFILAAIEIIGDQSKLLVQKAKEMGAPIDAEQHVKELDEDLEKTKFLFKKSLE